MRAGTSACVVDRVSLFDSCSWCFAIQCCIHHWKSLPSKSKSLLIQKALECAPHATVSVKRSSWTRS